MVQGARFGVQGAVSPDWEYLARAKRGDEAAWRTLLERHQAHLKALALFITGSAIAADDVVQETFLRAFAATVKHREGTVRGFLGTIAYRLAVKEARRVLRNAEFEGHDPVDNVENALDGVLKDERDRFVAQAIGTLDPEHRDVLVLHFYGGHSYEEIANITEIPLGTVKSRIFYAMKSCRETLRQKGVL